MTSNTATPELPAIKALREIERLLMDLQPHIPQACYPGRTVFIDNYVDPAIETARAAIAAHEAAKPTIPALAFIEHCTTLSGGMVSGNILAEKARQVLAADRAANSLAAPEGWKLVPIQPTRDMLCMFTEMVNDTYAQAGRAWERMLEHVPIAPSVAAGAVDAVREPTAAATESTKEQP